MTPTHRLKNRGHAQASHADDWLVTYADMITLLLCFFAIFLIVSVTKKNEALKALAVATAYEQQIEKPQSASSVERSPEKPNDASVAQNEPQQPTASPPVEYEKVETNNNAPQMDLEPISATAAQQGIETEKPMRIEPPTPAVEEPKSSTNFEKQGDRIYTFEETNAAFFDKGSATLSEAGKKILMIVSVNLKSETFKDFQITVEGHTDDTPIQTPQFPSNWELSTARSVSVVRFLLEQGIAPQRLRAAGSADSFPKAPNRDSSGKVIPENQAQNRRVVIKLEKIEKNS